STARGSTRTGRPSGRPVSLGTRCARRYSARVIRIPCSLRTALVFALACAAAAAHADPPVAAPPAAAEVTAVLRATSGDSLIAPLRALEIRLAAAPEAAEAAMALGQLHLARGEYREAVAAFGRASAR